MRVVESRVIVPHRVTRAALCGFVTYISETKPILLRRMGWEVGNDVHDDFADAVSRDNGQTWTDVPTTPANLKGKHTPAGFEFYVENAALFCPDQQRLLLFTDKSFTPGKDCDLDQSFHVLVTAADTSGVDAAQGGDSGLRLVGQPLLTDFGIPQGNCVSFCTPVRDTAGRVLVPVQYQRRDADGSIRAQGFAARSKFPDVMQDVWDVALLTGTFTSTGDIDWTLGEPVPCRFEKSSRGMCEGTVADLGDGRLAMVLRGSNAAWPEKPGYKWVSYSRDGGTTWTEAQPLACDDGSLIESSATGSILFRSIRNGRLYWLGNLCLEGVRAQGNDPRTPLVLAEMREPTAAGEPLALRRDKFFVVATRRPHEHPGVQMSNFKIYQDRPTGDLLIHLTKYAERGYENLAWMQADHVRYRVALD